MLYAGATKTVRGEKYAVLAMSDDFIVAGTIICFKNGRTVRKILCFDGDEVVLRGCGAASDVFEAVPVETICEQWYRLRPLKD